MKKIAIIILISVFTFTSFGQVDSSKIPINDSVPILSVRDIRPIYDELAKLPYIQAKPFIDYFERLVGVRYTDYAKRNKKKEEKPKK